ncbi:zinc-dependent alcohol dehydrogenase family protein [Paraburkholderia sp. MM6662-R1]|uniref:zinc-dependent alcohol dehydrogenase family protein n=1 Tax=Paraburkholderia sp. MM6662-R1 TaxID=2991066 RepID=UPI003D2354C7
MSIESETMRVIEVRSNSIHDLKIIEQPIPRPGRGEVLIRVRAASLNYRDLVIVKGTYSSGIKYPLVPLSDCCGEIVEVGAGVTRFELGERVIPTLIQGWLSGTFVGKRRMLGWPLPGVLQDYVVVPAEDAVAAPLSLSDAEAATLPIAAVTAWMALIETGAKAGEWVLVEGTGGVALFGLQLAKAMGARVAIITSSDEKAERALALGADHAINYRTRADWDNAVLEATAGRGVNVVVETVGSTIPRALSAMASGGRAAIVGFLGSTETSLNIVPFLEKTVSVRGIACGPRDQFEAMNTAIDACGIKPVVGAVFPMERAAEAFALMERGGHFGKIVIEM